MMAMHDVKIWPEFFDDVQTGRKSFELRKNDRGYKVGDLILFREWEPNTATFSGRHCTKLICYVLDGIGQGAIKPFHGLIIGYAILGLKDTQS